MKEKHNFLIKIVIRTKDDYKLIDLAKRQELEIDFWRSEGKIVGKKQKEVVFEFEKDGKKYQVLMKIDKVKKGWFKDEIVGCVFEPFPKEKFELYEPEFFMRTRYRSTEKYNPNTIKPTQLRKEGFILLGLLLIIVIVIVVWWKKRRKKGRVLNSPQ